MRCPRPELAPAPAFPPPGAAGALLPVVETVHAAAAELRRLHLGRLPVLGGRLQRDADSARDFAARMGAAPVAGRAGRELLLATRVFLEALLVDCRELAREEGLRLWSVDDARALEVRSLGRAAGGSLTPLAGYFTSLESAANTVICLVQQALFLVDRRPGGERAPVCRAVTSSAQRALGHT